MRSVLHNKLEEFLKILERDKTEWMDFWREYRKKLGPIVQNYERLHGLEEEDVKKLLERFKRPDLDRLKIYWEERKREGKGRVAFLLRRNSKVLDLSREDFVVFLFGGLAISTFSVVDGNREKVVLVDVVKVWLDGKIDDLDEVVLESVKRFRRGEIHGS